VTRVTSNPPHGHAVGILAGGGEVPVEIADALRRHGKSVYIVAIDAKASPRIGAHAHERISIGQVGRMLALFRHNRCSRLVIAGHLSRPDIFRLRIDFGFFLHLPTILSLLHGGDDYVLRLVIAFFERQGFVVAGIPDLAPELIADEGVLTCTDATECDTREAAYGYELIRKLGPFDIGQAVVVRDGRIIAIEGVDGTDAMLARLAEDHKDETTAAGTLIKATKPGQELRVDLPTIGTATVAACKKAGLKTIAVEAGRSVIAERDETVDRANRAGIGILGFLAAEDAEDELQTATMAPHGATLVCLTRHRATQKHLADAFKGLMAVRTIAAYATCPGVVVARQHILAVNVSEPLNAFVVRAIALRQWGNTRKRKRQGLLVVASLSEVQQIHSQAQMPSRSLAGFPDLAQGLAEASFAGLAVEDGASVPPEFLAQADRLGLLVLVQR